MRAGEVFRFEVGYQARRAWTWLFFFVLLAVCFQITREAYSENARDGGYFLNGAFVILSITVVGSVMGLLVAATLAGDAAARDVQTRIHPLLYTSRVGERAYLTGRFLAAFVVNALVMMSVQVALLLAFATSRSAPEIIGPFRPGSHVAAYVMVTLPSAFAVTALLFSIAALSRRAITAYLGAVVLFFLAILTQIIVAGKFGNWELARILDPLGLSVVSEISRSTTAAAKNAIEISLNRSLLLNRAVWIVVGFCALGVTHLRFRFDRVSTSRRKLLVDRDTSDSQAASDQLDRSAPVLVPRFVRTFGRATRLRQTIAIAAQSFREIAFSWGGLVLAGLTIILVILGPKAMNHMGVPLLPTTQQMTRFVGTSGEILWMIVPMLTVFYVGELIWRDRETGLSEIGDAAPVPEWVRLIGRFAGLGLLLVAYQTLMLVACVLVQSQLGYHYLELGLYARIFFGLQLTEHVLFALLAFAVHVIVNQKYVGHLIVLLVWAFTAFAPALGINHNLLVYGAAPDWIYSDIRGFGPFLTPWLWFKVYWAAWGLLLAVTAKVFWVRGREVGMATRFRTARRRLTRPTLVVVASSVALIVGTGGFTFYNTNVLNAYETEVDRSDQRAEYERRFGRFRGIPQPRLTGTTLRVEIYPEHREATIRGTFRLVNMSGVAIDSIHVAPESEVETGPISFDRPSTLVLGDDTLGYRIYALGTPLMPGDSVRMNFEVHFKPRGFTNGGVDGSVANAATFFEGNNWFPAIGYQSDRELPYLSERRAHGLPPRIAVRSLDDVAARNDMTGSEQIAFDAVIGTAIDQTAIAPGALRRTWTENGRRYFHYVANAPIRNDAAFYSARYAVRDAQWTDTSSGSRRSVAIQVIHHPEHSANVNRMIRSVQASLDYFSRKFGPYPYGELRLVEHASRGNSLHGAPINVEYEEGFSIFDPSRDSREIDFPFAVVAHEVAHQWWGNQLSPADVEGAPLMAESLAWYSAMSVVEQTYGSAHLGRLLEMMREAFLGPRSQAGRPLLRSYNRFQAYRTGPFAMYAVREYVGADRVNVALRRLFEKYGQPKPPLPTSLDLYHELQAVTPDSLRYLLADLFEANTFWELKTTHVASEPVSGGNWRVTLDVSARKTVVDTVGLGTDMPMNDFIEIGVFAVEKDGRRGDPLYLATQRIRSGEQRITLTVPREPGSAGIDPRHLLIDLRPDDNVRRATREKLRD